MLISINYLDCVTLKTAKNNSVNEWVGNFIVILLRKCSLNTLKYTHCVFIDDEGGAM